MIEKLDQKITLSNNYEMPGLGFGTWQSAAGDITVEAVKTAIQSGYRNIDTAAAYNNEESVGQAIRESISEFSVPRQEIFVSTKLWNDHRGYDKTMIAFEESMKKLKLDYLDLYMIHWPAVEKWHDDWKEINRSTWKAFEELYRDGRVKSIGVSNFLRHHIEVLIEDSDIAPMVNQIEYHPGFGQIETADYCLANNIVVEAWSPFGTGEVLNNKLLRMIAKSHHKTSAQICLRWLVQKKIVPLPKSVNEQRIIQNTQIFDFSLSDEEMFQIDNMPFSGGMRFDPDSAKS